MLSADTGIGTTSSAIFGWCETERRSTGWSRTPIAADRCLRFDGAPGPSAKFVRPFANVRGIEFSGVSVGFQSADAAGGSGASPPRALVTTSACETLGDPFGGAEH